MLIRNLPIEHSNEILLKIAYRLGRPLCYTGERNGQVIHEIRPKIEFQGKKSSLGFDQNLDLHTEMAFHHIRPNFVLLFCVRNFGTKTYLCSHEKILGKLNPITKKLLSFPHFCIHPPFSYSKPYIPEWKPILKNQKIIMANHCTIEFKNDMAKKAYETIKKISEEQKSGIILRSGDLLIIDNQGYVHGRSKFNHNNRLLKRAYVI